MTGQIKWCYFEYLHELQTNLSLKFANKISSVHINWQQNKMKVKTAVQLLSSSTANALQYLKDNNYTQFSGCDETINFCRTIDQIFDFLNSRSPFSKGYKSPIFQSNIQFIKDKIIPFIHNLYSLKFQDKFLFKSNKKTFIIGFAVAVKSIIEISEMIFTQNLNFKYILTYRFSQDHIELLFGRIRQRYGANNNPNVIQFKTALKQILLKNSVTCSSHGNCNTFDDNATLSIFSFKCNKKNQNINISNDNFSESEEIEIVNRSTLLNNANSDYEDDSKKNIIYYITGYALKKIIPLLDCNSCIQSLLKVFSEHSYHHHAEYSKFVDFKNNGGLVSPSECAFKIIYQAETFLLLLTNNLQSLNIKNIDLKIINLCNNKFAFDNNIFNTLQCDNVPLLDRPHKMVLISLLVKKYLSIRLHSFGKMFSTEILNPVSKRQKLTKQIIFMNQ